MALSAGATLVMVPTAVKMAPSNLASVLFRRQQVTVLQATPTLVHLLPSLDDLLGDSSCVRVLAFGGEACPSLEWLSRWKSPEVC